MPAWWFCLILSGLWLLTGILHAINGRTDLVLILYLAAALLSAILGIIKYILAQKSSSK